MLAPFCTWCPKGELLYCTDVICRVRHQKKVHCNFSMTDKECSPYFILCNQEYEMCSDTCPLPRPHTRLGSERPAWCPCDWWAHLMTKLGQMQLQRGFVSLPQKMSPTATNQYLCLANSATTALTQFSDNVQYSTTTWIFQSCLTRPPA